MENQHWRHITHYTRAVKTCGHKHLSHTDFLAPAVRLRKKEEAIVWVDEDSVLPHHQDQTPYPVIFQDALQQRREVAQQTGQQSYSEQRMETKFRWCQWSSKNSHKNSNSKIRKGKSSQCQKLVQLYTHNEPGTWNKHVSCLTADS